MLRKAEPTNETRKPQLYRYYLIRNFPLKLLRPWSRSDYENDVDASAREIAQNLRRYDRVADLLRAGEAVWPILVSRDGFIIDGYHRAAVMRDAGVGKVDVVVVELREDVEDPFWTEVKRRQKELNRVLSGKK